MQLANMFGEPFWSLSVPLYLKIFFLKIWEASELSTGSKVIKLFSCSTQLSTKFQLLLKTKITTNEEVSCFQSHICCIYHSYKC